MTSDKPPILDLNACLTCSYLFCILKDKDGTVKSTSCALNPKPNCNGLPSVISGRRTDYHKAIFELMDNVEAWVSTEKGESN